MDNRMDNFHRYESGWEAVSRSSGNELESAAVGRANDSEVAVVERGDGRLAESFGDGDDRGVNEPEPEIGIGVDQRDRSLVVVVRQFDDRKPGTANQVQKSCFRWWTEPGFNQPCRFRDR